MRHKIWVILAIALMAGPASGLQQSQIPPKFGLVWGQNAGAAYIRSIPTSSQIGIQNCAASLNDGMPPLAFTPIGAGGCPPFGQDFNGIFKQLSQWNQWQSAGGPVFFDGAFATSANGYPSGARLQSAVTPGTTWFNTADNNSTNPDTSTANQIVGGTGWVQDPGQIPIGTPIQSLTTVIPAGQVSANGLTIGNASSNATNRANVDTQFLFTFVWNNCTSTACPIFTSTGSASARGATAAADFAANKALAVPNMNAVGLMGADSQNGTTSAILSGVPVTAGNRTAPGSILGEVFHDLIAGEIPGISFSGSGGGTTANTITVFANGNPSISIPGTAGTISQGQSAPAGGPEYPTTTNNTWTGISAFSSSNNISVSVNVSGNSSNTGSGSPPHNTVERSTIVYWNLKL